MYYWLYLLTAFYVDREIYKKEINGVIKEKIKGSKGSLTLIISGTNSKLESFSLTTVTTSGQQLIQVTDSMGKRSDSYFFDLYKINQGKYEFYDSIEISHW